ncbi:phosphate-starvation-inducible protein PsiE [Erythrobacter rubeus]|uniref:Protein PsiE n=1 Tax=Erythrobacter rubeus TaxID=2760803 RepID=A0ABR8KUG0_9SPHN|nr:phosphate-starvation-inducible PsiE family protein [Erythrobacter rubeus]MBD2841871.1 phosphate-starvation-inducible PsiE family protein [Erythrobacter rubeus]
MNQPTPNTTSTDTPKVNSSDENGYASKLFKLVERFLLIITMIMTLAAVGVEVSTVIERGTIELADLLLMFLYTEVVGMIAVFYTGKGLFFVFPIFIAITAIARLIVLQGKDMAPENVLYEAAAILLLTIAAVVMGRFRSE